MLQICVAAAGLGYQRAAARAAATYVCVMGSSAHVWALVPRDAPIAPELEQTAATYGFSIQTFAFQPRSSPPLVTQFKCRALVHALTRIDPEALLLAVDADTFCNRFIELDDAVRGKILRGGVGMVRDLADHHSEDPRQAWYVAPARREPYVNAGVVLAGKGAADVFQRVLELSDAEEFHPASFYDQSIINYLLSAEFPGRLVLLDERYNGMRRRFNDQTIIGHWAGGAGELREPGTPREAGHERHCARILAAAAAGRIPLKLEG